MLGLTTAERELNRWPLNAPGAVRVNDTSSFRSQFSVRFSGDVSLSLCTEYDVCFLRSALICGLNTVNIDYLWSG